MAAHPPWLQVKPARYDRLKDLTHYSELKRLAYRIVALQRQKRFRSLAVLSSFPMEGKTLFCAALAMAYVDTCRSSVLVVDATTYHNPKSLNLKDCLDPSFSQIDYLSLADRRNKSNGTPHIPMDARLVRQQSAVEAEVVKESAISVSLVKESDHALISHVAGENAGHYGLVLLDTVSLMAQNKNNIDPLLVAHLADASVLMVSSKLLNASNLSACLKVMKDPALHLIGMVSNEEFSQ
ncbi:MAG: hypothetical protein A2992_04365 [Elusimicrobia bacterium RIFCSPLOWO2_01_FULL_59_12]|nr:MAG: hypothetical protein A2992_04365 [Elusimicrobia bacterium RIFCSPLOWO2_01_FULL_59_12]